MNIKKWSELKTWDDLMNMHIRWLRREIPGKHISNHKHDELDADDQFVKFLIKLSELANMITMDSQPSSCDIEYEESPPSYVRSVQERYPEYKDVDFSKGKELRRPYVSGYIPLSYALRLLEGWTERTNLVLWLCLPKQREVILKGGSFNSVGKFNLTKVQFKGTQFEDMVTNLIKDFSCTVKKSLRYNKNHPMKKVWKNIAWIGFSSIKHCEDDERFQQNLLRYIKSKLYE